jgi:restriction system protein
MTIPDFQTIMLPLLELAGDGREHSLREAVETLAERLGLSEDERKERLPSGRQPTFDNRVGWARTYLAQAGLLEAPRRGWFRITDRGREVLGEAPPRIPVQLLERFEEFRSFRERRRPQGGRPTPGPSPEMSPEEALEEAHQQLRRALMAELLKLVKASSPAFFERLVVDVLLAMGYGGSRAEAGHAIGRSGDEGIDGVISEDRLGLDVIYVQAKRWEHPVGRPEVQRFAGALQGHRARKGVFITTSNFTREAQDYASSIDSKVVLIDGETLVGLMIDHGVGVSTVASYDLKKVDQDYFTGD